MCISRQIKVIDLKMHGENMKLFPHCRPFPHPFHSKR